jgi:hypothetical protein
MCLVKLTTITNVLALAAVTCSPSRIKDQNSKDDLHTQESCELGGEEEGGGGGGGGLGGGAASMGFGGGEGGGD